MAGKRISKERGNKTRVHLGNEKQNSLKDGGKKNGATKVMCLRSSKKKRRKKDERRIEKELGKIHKDESHCKRFVGVNFKIEGGKRFEQKGVGDVYKKRKKGKTLGKKDR